jgi:hypothetical protein
LQGQSAECCIIILALECDTCRICCVKCRAVQCVFELFSAEQRVHLQYLCEVCVMENTLPTHSASTAMYIGTIYRIVDKFLTRYSRLVTQKV